MGRMPDVADLIDNAPPAGPASLHEEILARLRDFIVEGHLAPGARIPERQLCETLSVSRTPLREALKVLASEGLLELLPNRGARVRQYTEKDIRELFEVVTALECMGGHLACERISDREIEEIEALHYRMYAHYIKRELHEYFANNQRIHELIVTASRNSALVASHASYSASIRRIRYSANLHRDRWSEAMREHEDILDALRRRAADELTVLMLKHLRNKCDAACGVLRETDTSGPAEAALSLGDNPQLAPGDRSRQP